jgi:preprotein translocase subunit SecG
MTNPLSSPDIDYIGTVNVDTTNGISSSFGTGNMFTNVVDKIKEKWMWGLLIVFVLIVIYFMYTKKKEVQSFINEKFRGKRKKKKKEVKNEDDDPNDMTMQEEAIGKEPDDLINDLNNLRSDAEE